jgi:tRNA(Ile)-lysidine synthase
LECNDYIENEMMQVINDVFNQNMLNIEKLLELSKVIQHKVINYILETVYQDDLMLITDAHVELIYKLIKSNKANASVHLPNNISVIKCYNSITFTNEITEYNDYEIELIDYINLSNGMNLEIVDKCESNNNFVCRLNSKELKMPLYVRNRKLGDRIEIKGMLGRKKINDIFIDEKISLGERETWPIVLDSSDKVVWLPGLKKSKYDKEKNEKYDIIIKYY